MDTYLFYLFCVHCVGCPLRRFVVSVVILAVIFYVVMSSPWLLSLSLSFLHTSSGVQFLYNFGDGNPL